ncbi:MAG TPA: PAS domain S-box protein [Alphaproteobacteria bacterium]|jgi:PAS domain S-box-containing protein
MNFQREAVRAKARGGPTRAASAAAAIQPHGLLLVLDADTLKVNHVSANTGALLGCPPTKVIGSSIADYVDAGYVRALAEFGAGASRTAGPSGRVTLRGPAQSLSWRAASHRSGGTITVEIAPVPEGSRDLDGFLSDATATLHAVRDHAGIDATATTVARRLREMTGYERVMVVRFDAQAHAEVIAESKAPSAGSTLLGAHFHADEMPDPARDFALDNPIRMIHDLTAAPVPVLPATDSAGDPVDLTEAILRAAPPGQVRLLAGIGARSALVMSLVRERRLWGLVVFLHRAPRRLSLPHRSTLQLMADAVAVRFAAAEDQERERELTRRRRALGALKGIFERETGDGAAAIVRRHARSLLRIVGASGAWCHLPEADFALGHAPSAETAKRIAALCRARGTGRAFATDHVAALDPALADAAKVAAGALFVSLPRSRGSLLFLRGEAPLPRAPEGQPERYVRERHEAWLQARRNHGEPWAAADLAIAPDLAALVDDLAPRLGERRNIQRVLQNEAKLRAILDATQDGLIVIDRAGNIQDFSPGAERLFRCSVAEMAGQPVERLIPENLRERHRAGLARASHALHARTMGGDGQLLALRKDGTTFPFELTLTSLVQGGETLFIGALRDITERLSVEQRDRFWFEQSSVGYSVSDPITHRRLRVNPALCRILGYSERELLSMNVFETIHPDDAAAAQEWRGRVRAGSDAPYRKVHRFIRKDGKIVWGHVTALPIRMPASDAVEIVSELIEITELMEADAKLRAALSRAEAASASKSQFLATMSHELRTPLNAIIGLSEMISSEIMGPLGNVRYADYVRDIHRAGRHLLDLVTDVLDTSRIEAGGYRLIPAPLQAKDVIEETHRIVGPLAAERGVRLERAIEENLPLMRGDRRALKQILINVMSNAVKYTPAGGSIVIRAKAEPDRLAIAVADTGSGIPPEDLPHVIEPFYRAGDAYTSGAAGGAGLGLSIANGLVQAHGGSLAIASKVGVGTTVTLRFPLAPAAP